MAIEILQVGTTSTPKDIGPLVGNSQVILSVPTTAAVAVVTGLSQNVNATSGYTVNPGVPHTFTIPPASAGAELWAVSSSASVLTLLIVTST